MRPWCLHPQALTITLARNAASADPPAEEFRNTPPETGVGEEAFQAPAPILNLVPLRCSKVSLVILALHSFAARAIQPDEAY